MARIALGANPAMTQRQKQQLADDANEVMTRSTRSSGSTGVANGAVTRTRDRMQAEVASQREPARPKTPKQLAGEAGLAMHNQLLERQAQEERERLTKIAARRQQERDEVAARERKSRQAQREFEEQAVLREISDLTPDECQRFWEKFGSMDATDVGAASVLAEAIRLTRNGGV